MITKQKKKGTFWFSPNSACPNQLTCDIQFLRAISSDEVTTLNTILLGYQKDIAQITLNGNVVRFPIIALDHYPLNIYIELHSSLTLKKIAELSMELQNDGILERYVNPSSHAFYEKFAYNILSCDSYPDSISTYLKQEKNYFRSRLEKLNQYTAIFEVGCADSRNSDLSEHFGLNYYGIDLIQDLVDKAKLTLSRSRTIPSYDVKCMSALDITPTFKAFPSHENPLCLFPFNAIGNMGNFPYILYQLQHIAVDFIVSTYQMNHHTHAMRERYYINAGCTKLKRLENEYISTFVSEEGLMTSAYSQSYFSTFSNISSYDMYSQELGPVGVAYHFRYNANKERFYENAVQEDIKYTAT